MAQNFDSQLASDNVANIQMFAKIKKHGENVANIAVLIGYELKTSDTELDLLKQSALLHDYGKYYIPLNILLKPSKLTFEEMEKMKKHAYYGYRYANYKDFNKDIADCILCHHENYDGTGYYGLKGNQIPLCSRIIRIVDVYDALTSNRAYRQALNPTKALDIMEKEKSNFDKDIYNLFINKVSNKIHNSAIFG